MSLRLLFCLCLCLALLRPASAPAAAVTLTRDGDRLTLANGAAMLRYDLRSGLADIDLAGIARIQQAHAAVQLTAAGGPGQLRSTETVRRVYEQEPVADAFGQGVRLTVSGEAPGLAATLTQRFTMYAGRPLLLVQAEAGRTAAARGAPLAVSQIEALAAGGVTHPPGSAALAAASDPRLYLAPFFNDGDFATPPAGQAQQTVSYWLGGLVDAASGAGLIAGATESQAWKSAVWWDGPTAALSLFSGLRSPIDSVEPAPRQADRLSSAEFLLGGYADHRDGLADLMRAVALRSPPLPEPALPPPLGWNPWYQYRFGADEQMIHAIAAHMATSLAGHGYRYVNLDAGWNVMDGDWRASPERFPAGMAALTQHIHERGLLAGSYFIPFAVNPALLDQPAPGTPYLFRDLVLRDAAGAPVRGNILDFDYVLDGSHPGTLAYLRATAAAIAADGFDFVKLDFLQIGTQEGRRHNPAMTAMQSFHQGMQAVLDGFHSAGRPIYLSAAIAPLYVHPYVHSRRVGTDVNFGQARQAQNVALSWFTDLLYVRNDPDNVVVRHDWFPGYSDAMARMHATMSALGGTLFILGDDPRYLRPERTALLTDPEVLALAKEGVAARPLTVGETPAPVWSARLRDGAVVAGFFNWSDEPVQRTVPLSRLGLDITRRYEVHDLWDGDAREVSGSLSVTLPPRSAALLRIGP